MAHGVIGVAAGTADDRDGRMNGQIPARYVEASSEVLLEMHEYAEFMLKSMKRGGPRQDAITLAYIYRSVIAASVVRQRREAADDLF